MHELFETLHELHRSNALIFVYTDVGFDATGARNPARPNLVSGLVCGHGYSVLQLLDLHEEGLRLAQLRSIWGSELQWRGAWSEGSSEWQKFPAVRRRHLLPEHRSASSGRFWMAWPDFCAAFGCMEVCPVPAVTRKASHAPSLPAVARSLGSHLRRLRPGYRAGSTALAWRFLPWHCCSVESAVD